MSVVAPEAPGALGQAVQPPAMLAFLDALQQWLRARQEELGELDRTSRQAATSSAPSPERLTDDLVLSWALWKACEDRLELLLATWDSGRVGERERLRLATLTWGRLDATLDSTKLTSGARSLVGGLALSLPEACRLSDALAAQLRRRLQLDPDAEAVLGRLKGLRASRARVRDQVKLEPPALRARSAAKLDDLSTRLDAAAAAFERGADIGGLLGGLEIGTANLERDLIVANATRREARGLLHATREQHADIVEREASVQALFRRCHERVDPTPRVDIPTVAALGPVPNTVDEIEAHQRRLTSLSDQLSVVQHTLSATLRDREELLDRFALYRSKAASLRAEGDELALAERLTDSVLRHRPTPMQAGERLVASYQALLEWTTARQRHPRMPAGAAGGTGL